jgi:hypothetical protein
MLPHTKQLNIGQHTTTLIDLGRLADKRCSLSEMAISRHPMCALRTVAFHLFGAQEFWGLPA